jgi:hypothetical protein
MGGSELNDDSEGNHDPLDVVADVVAKDRRRLGRVTYHSRHLIALLRGQSVIESPSASDRNAEESPPDLGAKRKGDDLSAARGIILWALVGAGLWAVIIWSFLRLV